MKLLELSLLVGDGSRDHRIQKMFFAAHSISSPPEVHSWAVVLLFNDDLRPSPPLAGPHGRIIYYYGPKVIRLGRIRALLLSPPLVVFVIWNWTALLLLCLPCRFVCREEGSPR